MGTALDHRSPRWQVGPSLAPTTQCTCTTLPWERSTPGLATQRHFVSAQATTWTLWPGTGNIARGWSLWKLPANSNVRMGCSESYVRQGRLSGTLTSKLPVLLAGSAQNFFLQLSGPSGETSSPGKSRASTQRNSLLVLRNQDVAQTRTWLGQETRRVPSIAAPTRDLARLPVPPSVTSSRAAIVATDKPVISPEGHAGHAAGRLHCKLQLLRQHATEVASGVLAGCKPMLGLRCDGAGCMQACAQLRTRRLRLRYTHNTQPM